MKDYLGDLWAKLQAKNATLAGLATMAANNLSVAVETEDVEKVNRYAVEVKELGAQMVKLGMTAQKVVADGSLSIMDGSAVAIELQRTLDEAEDVIKRVDEDDASDTSLALLAGLLEDAGG